MRELSGEVRDAIEDLVTARVDREPRDDLRVLLELFEEGVARANVPETVAISAIRQLTASNPRAKFGQSPTPQDLYELCKKMGSGRSV